VNQNKTDLATDDRRLVGNLEAVAGAGVVGRQVEANEVDGRVEMTAAADELEQILHGRPLCYRGGDTLTTHHHNVVNSSATTVVLKRRSEFKTANNSKP